MLPYQVLNRNEHFKNPGPKRILSLDGGGIRGIVSLGYLQCIESLLRKRFGGNPKFRLSDYFDLIAGTSTGAIIAAGLARGMTVTEIDDIYMQLGKEVFVKSMWRRGILRPRYSQKKLAAHLTEVLGEDTTLGSLELRTGLLVMTKRMDTGSPWALANNPNGVYYEAPEGETWASNRDLPLWQVVRASTAAPSFFEPEKISIGDAIGINQVVGEFVDGGVSPFNNPTLQAFMYATLGGYRVGWNTGKDNLLIVSIGTGRGDPSKAPSWIAAKGAVQSLLSLMDDNAALVETIAQWFSIGPTHRKIDSELGDLKNDFIGDQPLFTYSRFDLSLTREGVDAIKPEVTDDNLANLASMDEPDNMPILKEISALDARVKVSDENFPTVFDLN